MIKVTVNDSDLFQKLKAATDEKLEYVDAILEGAAYEINAVQISRVPVDEGHLKGVTRVAETAKGFELVSQAFYAPYMEFGTKGNVDFQYAELAAIAAQYKGKGAKGDAKKAIYEWAKRQGIDEKYWYIIFISIMKKGVKPKPYFFAPFFEKKESIIQDIKDVL